MKKKTAIPSFFGLRRRWLNKYVITLLLFVSWLLFFDKYNFFAQQRLDNTAEKLEQEYAQLVKNIEIAKGEKSDLLLNQEKYGREKYYLHKDDEDVFIIEKKEK